MKNKEVFFNLLWRFAERTGAQIVTFVVSIILARILEPEAYGTIALINVFITILQVFVDSGLGNALIQKKDADDLDFSTVFFTNIVFCIGLYVLMYIMAPYISAFYNSSSMTAYIRVVSITILISGVKNVQQAYVSRHMLFKKFFFSTLAGTLVAGIIGTVMAVNGLGIWALVAQQVFNLLIGTIILWCSVKWRPSFLFSVKRLRILFSYGWKLLVSALIDTGFNELRSLLIGKMYTSADLAYYNQGQKFPSLIVTNINTSIDSVLLPAMSNVQDNKLHIRNMTRRSIKVSTYAMAPLMIGLACVAPTLVKLVLTEKWLFCVPYMRIFCVTYMFYPIHTSNLNAIKAMGRSDLFLKLEIVKKVVGLVVLLVTIKYGVMAMACSLLLTSVINQIINSWPNKKLLDYSYIEQIKDIVPSISLAVVMGMIVNMIRLTNLPNLIILVIQVIVGAIIYIGGSAMLKIDSYEYILEIVKPFLLKIYSKMQNK